jgi:MtN3 and saliva related transmembrane protein
MAALEIELIGYLAGIIIAVSITPQVIKSWRTKSTKDISTGWTLIYIIGLVIFEFYAIGIWSVPLIFTNVIELLLAFSLLTLKMRYD